MSGWGSVGTWRRAVAGSGSGVKLRLNFKLNLPFPWLDESYVFCFQRRGADLLQEVRKGFGLERQYGLEGRIVTDPEGPAQPSEFVTSGSGRSIGRRLGIWFCWR